MSYKNKHILQAEYQRLGSTHRVGKHFGVSNGTIIHWMRKYGLPRIPKLHLYYNNSGKGRLGELYVLGHPYFKNDVVDVEQIDDKHPVDLLWRCNKTNVKTSHYKRPMFRIKNGNKRHKVSFYICLYYEDKVSKLIPEEIWILPYRIVSYSNVSPGMLSKKSKFHRYKLSLRRDKDFSSEEENKFNRYFTEKYQSCLANN